MGAVPGRADRDDRGCAAAIDTRREADGERPTRRRYRQPDDLHRSGAEPDAHGLAAMEPGTTHHEQSALDDLDDGRRGLNHGFSIPKERFPMHAAVRTLRMPSAWRPVFPRGGKADG